MWASASPRYLCIWGIGLQPRDEQSLGNSAEPLKIQAEENDFAYAHLLPLYECVVSIYKRNHHLTCLGKLLQNLLIYSLRSNMTAIVGHLLVNACISGNSVVCLTTLRRLSQSHHRTGKDRPRGDKARGVGHGTMEGRKDGKRCYCVAEIQNTIPDVKKKKVEMAPAESFSAPIVPRSSWR